MIVIDANLAIRAVLPTGEKDLALARLAAGCLSPFPTGFAAIRRVF